MRKYDRNVLGERGRVSSENPSPGCVPEGMLAAPEELVTGHL